MDLQLKDRTALIMGGGGGLGGAIAQALAAEGARVVVADVDIEAANAAAARIAAEGRRAIALQWDLADLEGIDSRVSSIEHAFGPVEVLVNNTGGPPPTTAHGQPPDLWRRHFEAMVLAVIATAIVTGHAAWLWLAPVAGYGCAWIGHFVFEKNRPATFTHPLYSLMGDWVMYWQILRGKVRI